MSVERWERRSEVPLILLALSFLLAYAWPVLDPRLDPDLRTVLNAVLWTVWTAFAVDLLVRLVLTDNARSYALRRRYDVALVALPLLRPLRLLRLLALVRILDRPAASNLAGQLVGYGDRFPVTAEGRLVAVALTVVGIGLVGSVTAAVAACIVGRVASESADRAP